MADAGSKPATSTNTLRSTDIGWPFLLRIYLYSLGLLRAVGGLTNDSKTPNFLYFLSMSGIFSVSLPTAKSRSPATHKTLYPDFSMSYFGTNQCVLTIALGRRAL